MKNKFSEIVNELEEKNPESTVTPQKSKTIYGGRVKSIAYFQTGPVPISDGTKQDGVVSQPNRTHSWVTEPAKTQLRKRKMDAESVKKETVKEKLLMFSNRERIKG
ncbi:MAG: hypothetical protein K0Q74_750 [Gammaproteobacteria bacterium]|nr:hypothetical protein [Gammaproteobacteria bacterium]